MAEIQEELSLLTGWPLSPALAPAVASFRAFLAAARDISDDRLSEPAARLDALTRLDRAVSGAETSGEDAGTSAAAALRASAIAADVSLDHARHVLQACQWDARGKGCRSWSELLTYCRYCAAPIGRFLIELHREDERALGPAEALCSALRILWQIQNASALWRDHGRVYLPTDWLAAAGVGPESLAEPRLGAPLRHVMAQVLDGVDRLHQVAAPLPNRIADRNLRRGAAITFFMSRRLAVRLRRGDPLSGPIRLSSIETAGCKFVGLWKSVAAQYG